MRLAALAAVLLVAPAIVHAQDAEDAEITRMAKEHYKLGVDAFKAGKYPEAIKELKKAYLLKRLPPLLVNIAKTYDKLNDPDNAIYYYKKYLAEAPPDAKDRDQVKQAMDELQHKKDNPDEAAGEEQPEAPPPRSKRQQAAEDEQAGQEAPPPKKSKRAQQAAEEEQPADEAPPPPKKSKRAQQQVAEEEQPADEAPRRAKPAPVAMPSEWAHSPIDAAPPKSPIDVRVQTPVMKGVKVYLYFRSAGQAEFTAVLMKRRGAEKIGRIPGEAVTGKSIQYYLEAKDATGTVVKNSGTQLDPNIVFVDPTAKPLVASSEGAEMEDAGRGEGGDEQPSTVRKASHGDDEAAPLGDEAVRREKSEAAGGGGGARPPVKHKLFGPMGWAGIGVIGLGVVAGVVGGVLLGQAKSFAGAVANDALDPHCNTDSPGATPINRKCAFNDTAFVDQANSVDQTDLSFQVKGKTFNTAGIALAAAGGGLAVVGAVLAVVDHFVVQQASDPDDKPAKPVKGTKKRSRSDDEQSSTGNPLIRNFAAAPVLSPSTLGIAASFNF